MAIRFFFALLACGALPAETADLRSDALIAEGSALFATNCAVGYCHGSAGRSARGPALRDRAWDPRELYRITRDGLPGTSMPAWKGILEDQAIAAITAYVMTLASEPLTAESASLELDGSEPPSVQLSAAAERGRELFFDLTRERRCGVCHAIGDRGSPVGPNLAATAKQMPAAQLKRNILKPGASIAFGFELTEVRTRDGERIAGVLEEETEHLIRLYDTSALPPPLRTIERADIRQSKTRERSPMPADAAEAYRPQELDAIVAFLEEL